MEAKRDYLVEHYPVSSCTPHQKIKTLVSIKMKYLIQNIGESCSKVLDKTKMAKKESHP